MVARAKEEEKKKKKKKKKWLKPRSWLMISGVGQKK